MAARSHKQETDTQKQSPATDSTGQKQQQGLAKAEGHATCDQGHKITRTSPSQDLQSDRLSHFQETAKRGRPIRSLTEYKTGRPAEVTTKHRDTHSLPISD